METGLKTDRRLALIVVITTLLLGCEGQPTTKKSEAKSIATEEQSSLSAAHLVEQSRKASITEFLSSALLIQDVGPFVPEKFSIRTLMTKETDVIIHLRSDDLQQFFSQGRLSAIDLSGAKKPSVARPTKVGKLSWTDKAGNNDVYISWQLLENQEQRDELIRVRFLWMLP